MLAEESMLGLIDQFANHKHLLGRFVILTMTA